jgi:hypothetical protein
MIDFNISFLTGVFFPEKRKGESLEKAQHDKIENVAGSGS